MTINVTSPIMMVHLHIQYKNSVSGLSRNINYAFRYLPGWLQVSDQKVVFILLLRRAQTLESYTILVCYCKDCTCEISGSITLVKIRDIPEVSTSVLFCVSLVIQGKQSIRIGIFSTCGCS